ncbi:MAG: hypothetical protein QN120_05265 [Armatimonadota bacterium]|nr:hypothetical protein [Armatimonadota bacterium]
MPTPQELLAALALLGQAPGGGPAQPAPGPAGPGPAAPAAPPPGLLGLPAGGPPLSRLSLAALGQLAPAQPAGQMGLQRVKQALEFAQRLIALTMPYVQTANPQVAKDLHVIGRQIADARLNLFKEGEEEAGPPPQNLLSPETGVPGVV